MNKNKRTQQNEKGFVALMMVMTVSLLVGGFLVFASPRLVLQNESVTRAQQLAQARFDAYSCIEIAQLLLFQKADAEFVEEIENQIVGEYDAPHESCRIDSVESVRWNGDDVWVVETTGFSNEHAHSAQLEVRLSASENEEPRLEIVSVREI